MVVVSTTTRPGRSPRATARPSRGTGLRARRGFSLLELTIVVLIIATITVIALPRITDSGDNADVAALHADFRALNEALELYRVEHGGAYPAAISITDALTMFSNAGGTSFADMPDKANGVVFGPYLRRIPPLPLGPNEGRTVIATTAAPHVGWIYRPQKGLILPNLTGADGNVLPDVEGFLDVGGTTNGADDSAVGGAMGGGAGH
jgi:prepilin-type N-terminal cleavage/methylation domain-containing protein